MGRIQLDFRDRGRILSEKVSKDYDYVIFIINKKKYTVHSLVYYAFKDFDLDSNLEINHIDGNKENNKLDNLEIVTHKGKRHMDIYGNMKIKVCLLIKLQ